jgi:hypothetical protein
MHIQFYGHSICIKDNGSKFETFIDFLLNKYSATNEYSGQAFCSEERILYNLKKTKNIDVAVIFHSLPEFYFIPTADRDFNKMAIEDMPYKISHMSWYLDAAKDKNIFDCERSQVDDQEVISMLSQYQKFCISPDLLKNRFYGALMQIDQYVKFKNIKTVHCVLGSKSLPNWFQFNHGVVDYTLGLLQNQHLTTDTGDTLRDENHNPVVNTFAASWNNSTNGVNLEGNQYIADKLSAYIDKLL